MTRPNILLITADQWRGDCLGCMGHPDVLTPHLDDLAQNGIAFEHAYTACPSCIPARAALHTGMSQEHHGRVGYRDGVRWDYPHTLAGELTRAGYQTQCVGKMHVHPLRNSLGFMNVELHDGYLHYYRNPSRGLYDDQRVADDYIYWLKKELGAQADVTDTGIDCNSWTARPWPYPEYTHPTNWATDRAIDFLRRRDPDMPFFLNVSYVRPHPPLDAPQAFFDMYDSAALTAPAMGDWADGERIKREGRSVSSATGPIDEKLRRMAQAGYYAAITQIDYQIGRLTEALFSAGVSGNTIIMFTSDHGEMLCDHNLFRKSLPYEGSAHVPMIISGSITRDGIFRALRSKPDKLIELRDVMPTLLSFAGADIPETVDGMNIMDTREREYIHGEHINGVDSNQWIVTKKDKYIWFCQRNESDAQYEQYFDLSCDPTELYNGIRDGEYTGRAEYLRSILVRELSARQEGFVQNGRLATGCRQDAITNCASK
ncbi:MAG: arylsulfatase [Eubacteriales bacterium]